MEEFLSQGLTPTFHCSASPGLSLNLSVPAREVDGALVYSECDQYVDISLSNATAPCRNGWTYLWEDGYTSIVSWMNLVCDRSYQVELTTTMYMVGTTAGVIFLPPLSDRLGSKSVMLVCLWVQAVLGTVLIWADNIAVFCVLKFCIGVCNMSIALSAYVLMTETFCASHRALPTISINFFWALGTASIALLGYALPAWQDLELAIALPINILSISFVVIIPDSLPWLLSKGKVKQAEKVIERYIWVNNLPPIPDLQKKLSEFEVQNIPDIPNQTTAPPSIDVHRCSTLLRILTLFRTPQLRTITLVMFYLFLTNSLAYFGTMYNAPNMAGSRFLNVFLLGIVDIPGHLICIVSNRMIGRRLTVFVFMLLCGVCNLAVIAIPDSAGLHGLRTALIVLGKLGIGNSYATIYLYASEVFPTNIRNQALGASSFFENLGSIAAPNLVYVGNAFNDLPLALFGAMTLVGCVLVLMLPETHNQPMPQTVADVEGRQDSVSYSGTELWKRLSVWSTDT